jgi:hypothetical protein
MAWISRSSVRISRLAPSNYQSVVHFRSRNP